MANTYKIYKYTNLINGMSYIGQTSYSLKQRAHSDGSGYFLCTTHFGPAIMEFGWSNFKAEILLTVKTKEMAKKAEVAMIIGYNTQWPNGYNSALGFSNPCSEETKRILSIANRGNKARLGCRNSEEANRKNSEAHKGKHPSEETRRKMSESRKGKPAWNKGKRGYHWFTNEQISVFRKECPEGFRLGRTLH